MRCETKVKTYQVEKKEGEQRPHGKEKYCWDKEKYCGTAWSVKPVR